MQKIDGFMKSHVWGGIFSKRFWNVTFGACDAVLHLDRNRYDWL
jgi:hypothetical protein